MTPAEVRAFNAGVKAVRAFAKERVEAHQGRIRRNPRRRWTVTLGFLGGFGGVVSHCEQILMPEPENRSCG